MHDHNTFARSTRFQTPLKENDTYLLTGKEEVEAGDEEIGKGEIKWQENGRQSGKTKWRKIKKT